MGIHGHYFLSRDEAHFVSPDGWDFDIYSFQPKQFAFSKTSMQLDNHVEIVRYNFLSRIRFRAVMKRPKLQFDFIDSYSTESSRLQMVNGVDSILMISIGGSHWEGVSDVGALGIEVNFDEELTAQILAHHDDPVYHDRVRALIGGQSLVLPLDRASMNMKAFVKRYLRQVEPIQREQNPTELGLHLPRVSLEVADFQIRDSARHFASVPHLVLAEMARTILGSWYHSDDTDRHIVAHHRRMIALEIEKILWGSPLIRESDHDIALDEIAAHFKVSRRTIQLAVQEHFGIGFIALRRLIRLHQLRHEILNNPDDARITSLANEFYLGHMGRVARDYAQLFGSKPSQDRFMFRQSQKAQRLVASRTSDHRRRVSFA